MIETAGRDQIAPEDLTDPDGIDLLGSWGFLGMHLAAAASLFTGVSWAAVGACAVTFWARMFGITAGYHRYFSHRSFRTGRLFRFVLAFLGASAGQNGPIWWVSHHRLHHRHADTERDAHSPDVKGFWEAHCGWILRRTYKGYDASVVRDLTRMPEIRWLDRHHLVAPATLAAATFGLGALLAARWPELGTSGLQVLGWGFFVSTVLCWHVTFLVNSVSHTVGSRRFDTGDESRNNLWVALLTLGEGWHNNHHRWPSSERQGFYWWELDPSHYLLRLLEALGVVRDLKAPPTSVYDEAAG